MYNPKLEPKKLKFFKFEASKRYLRTLGITGLLATLTAAFFAFRALQDRDRNEIVSKLKYDRVYQPRVLILGGGTAGAAMASIVVNGHPEAHVTVVEKEKKTIFNGLFPLAHVGHRSYDLNTTGGIDFLRSRVSINVHRDAHLVMGEVLKVIPEKQTVIVKPEKEVQASESEDCTVLPDGNVSYPYDVLIVSTGAKRTLAHLKPFLDVEALDNYRIAVNPGATRDILGHLFAGNVVHVKMPPTSFIKKKEELRAKRKDKPVEICVPIRYTDLKSSEEEEYQKLCQISTIELNKEKPEPTTADFVSLYPSRQHDMTFAATVNMMWKYLDFFKKFSFIAYTVATADDQPVGPAPPVVNEEVLSFWKERQDSPASVNHFRVLRHSYITRVSYKDRTVQLYNYRQHALVTIPYSMLLLDLPLSPPPFVARSNLHKKYLLKDKHISLEGEAGFMDVDPQTLQHREYPNIFAIGDVAGLPTIKSYGSVYAQLGVVLHNVEQILFNVKMKQRIAELDQKYQTDLLEYKAKLKSHKEGPPPTAPVKPQSTFVEREANAKFDGYSSFHFPMTTWRAMWPEMKYNPQQVELFNTVRKTVSLNKKGKSDLVLEEEWIQAGPEPLEHTDHHLWRNTAWRDVRGLLNATFYQFFIYELMYIFLFHHGGWFSKTGLTLPTYSVEDGTPENTSWF